MAHCSETTLNWLLEDYSFSKLLYDNRDIVWNVRRLQPARIKNENEYFSLHITQLPEPTTQL